MKKQYSAIFEKELQQYSRRNNVEILVLPDIFTGDRLTGKVVELYNGVGVMVEVYIYIYIYIYYIYIYIYIHILYICNVRNREEEKVNQKMETFV